MHVYIADVLIYMTYDCLNSARTKRLKSRPSPEEAVRFRAVPVPAAVTNLVYPQKPVLLVLLSKPFAVVSFLDIVAGTGQPQF